MFVAVHVGDLNDDEMDDLYCHTTGGQTSVAISTVKGKTLAWAAICFCFFWGGVEGFFV